jgi:hypothetical protein
MKVLLFVPLALAAPPGEHRFVSVCNIGPLRQSACRPEAPARQAHAIARAELPSVRRIEIPLIDFRSPVEIPVIRGPPPPMDSFHRESVMGSRGTSAVSIATTLQRSVVEDDPPSVFSGDVRVVREISVHPIASWLDRAYDISMAYVGDWATWAFVGGPEVVDVALRARRLERVIAAKTALFLAGEILSRRVGSEQDQFTPGLVLGDVCAELEGELGRVLLDEMAASVGKVRRKRFRLSYMRSRDVLREYPWANLHLACPIEMDDSKLRQIALHSYIGRDILVGEQPYGSLMFTTSNRASVTETLYEISVMNPAVLRGGLEVTYSEEISAGDGVFRHWFGRLTSRLFGSGGSWFEFDQTDGVFRLKSGLMAEVGKGRLSYRVRGVLEGIGRVVALSVIEKIPLGVRLSYGLANAFLGKQHGWTHDDLMNDDPVMARNLKWYIDCLIREDCREVLDGVRFVASDGTPLRDRGDRIKVTQINVEQYVYAMRKYVMYTQYANVYTALRDGFSDIIAEEISKNVMTPKLLVDLVLGETDISLTDIQENVVFGGGYTQHSTQVQWLWSLLGRSGDMRKKFMKFVTGLDAVPPGGLGTLGQKIQIVRTVFDGRNRYPKARTCFFQFQLPAYHSRSLLEETLTESFAQSGLGLV